MFNFCREKQKIRRNSELRIESYITKITIARVFHSFFLLASSRQHEARTIYILYAKLIWIFSLHIGCSWFVAHMSCFVCVYVSAHSNRRATRVLIPVTFYFYQNALFQTRQREKYDSRKRKILRTHLDAVPRIASAWYPHWMKCTFELVLEHEHVNVVSFAAAVVHFNNQSKIIITQLEGWQRQQQQSNIRFYINNIIFIQPRAVWTISN